jgi:hypothetical protein
MKKGDSLRLLKATAMGCVHPVCLAGNCAGLPRARPRSCHGRDVQRSSPDATVTLLNSNTGVETVRQSGANGQYLFDFVEPGTYQVSAEAPGLRPLRATEHHRAGTRRRDRQSGLRVGVVAETITVAESAVEIQFNTSTMSLTVDRKMLTDLPVLARNPFTLALLDPAVVNRYTSNLATRNPFYMWSSSSMDVGGNTSRKNDLLLDGAPLQLNHEGLLRTAHGRRSGVHGPAERGGRRVRPLGRRRHEPVDEVRHERVSTAPGTTWAATRR